MEEQTSTNNQIKNGSQQKDNRHKNPNHRRPNHHRPKNRDTQEKDRQNRNSGDAGKAKARAQQSFADSADTDAANKNANDALKTSGGFEFAPKDEISDENAFRIDVCDIIPPICRKEQDNDTASGNAGDVGGISDSAALGDGEKMQEIIGVRFTSAGKVYYFDPHGVKFTIGKHAIVETARGAEYGEVAISNRKVSEKNIVQPLRPVIRMATKEDTIHNEENRKKEDEAFTICQGKIAAHGLDMKLIQAEYTFDNSKLLFYFTSSGRVDFRDLVKDLAGVFRTRIELRQIGIRDEAKMIGGLGTCGRPLCCASFLSDFGQVSIKMAKEQSLSLNSAKISGCCGRLMCCLRYEYPVYESAIKDLPPVDSTVRTVDGVGNVTEIYPLSGTVKVSFGDAKDAPPKIYKKEEIKVLKLPSSENGNEKE